MAQRYNWGPEIVRRLTVDQLLNYMSANYTPYERRVRNDLIPMTADQFIKWKESRCQPTPEL